MHDIINTVTQYLPPRHKCLLTDLNSSQKQALKEVRYRLSRPIMLDFGSSFNSYGKADKNDISYILGKLSDHSLNSVKESLCKGYITLSGGIRAGISGEAVLKNGEITFLHNINGINFRIPREKNGIADRILNDIFDGKNVFNTLVLSPPMMGKTTLLRDIARQLSSYFNVCVIDERNEIAACVNGIPSFDVGDRTDIISGSPKDVGIIMAIRSLSPDVILTDEIGSVKDVLALYDAAGSGVKFIASMHGEDQNDAKQKQSLNILFANNIIKRIIILGKNGIVGQIKDVIKL